MIVDSSKYYLYRHIRLDTNQPFYIGIGTKKNKSYKTTTSEYERAYTKGNRNKYWSSIVNKSSYKVEILLESNDYEFIKEKEIEFVSLYGRKDLKTGILVNNTSGGEGMKNLSEDTKNLMSFRKTGIKRSKEVCEKLSKNSPKYWKGKTGKEHYKSKPILQKSLNGDLIAEWSNVMEASRNLNIDTANIYRCCNNLRKTAYGFKWKYKQ